MKNSRARRKCGIICTLGPKSSSVDMITKLRGAGMNIVRLNFSHGSYDYHRGVIENTRASIARDILDGAPIAIALDTKGPEIRTGLLSNDPDDVALVAGAELIISVDPQYKDKCSAERVYVDYVNLPKVVPVGGTIFIDDGLIELTVEAQIDEKNLLTRIRNNGRLGSRKGVNLPDTAVDLPALSEKDRSDLNFGVEMGVDMIFASFIRKASDVLQVREQLGEAGKHIKIISKIENHEGVRNFDSILEVTDGVMVARGDLGIEIPPHKVFIAQKMMIARCNAAGKPVICATQMLESMTFNPRPTRAEVSDVANAVLDGADCVMLSGETAKGKYPLEAVRLMSRVCLEAERVMHHDAHLLDMMATLPPALKTEEAIALSAVVATLHHNCKAIVTLTNSGDSVRLLAKYMPPCPIIVTSRDPQILRQMRLHRGTILFHYPIQKRSEPWQLDVEERVMWTLAQAKKHSYVSTGDSVVLVHGSNPAGVHISLTDFHVRTVE